MPNQHKHPPLTFRPPESDRARLRELVGVTGRPVNAILTEALRRYLDQRPVGRWYPYQSRPGRGALVATDLADLRGPTSGTVELPLRLHWSGEDRTFDLDDPEMLRLAYEAILREAVQPAELATWLDGQTLVAVWPALFLPKGVRRAWEEEHPALRTAHAEAA